MIRIIILTIFLMCTVSFSNEHNEHKHLSYDASITLLQSIHDDAIVLGNGGKRVYAFIDPLCPHSRKFIKMVSENPIMLSKYKYHLFLYSIPRMKSTDVVSAVFMSKNSLGTLLNAMVDEDVHYDKGNNITQARVDRIAAVAQEMDVYKRPYIFIIK